MEYSMNTTPLAVSQAVTVELIDATGASTPMEAELQYDSNDPFAVTVVFIMPASRVEWTFGRDLLCEGLYEPTGDGDVHVWPCLDADGRAVVIIELCSPDGEALVQARTGDVTNFVKQMNDIVPVGGETDYIDMDAAIASLLDSPAA